jgi:hypothetical protein
MSVLMRNDDNMYASAATMYDATPVQNAEWIPNEIAITIANTEAQTEVAPLIAHNQGASLEEDCDASRIPSCTAEHNFCKSIPVYQPIAT